MRATLTIFATAFLFASVGCGQSGPSPASPTSTPATATGTAREASGAEANAPDEAREQARRRVAPTQKPTAPTFVADVASIARENTDFRRVLFTGARSQLVVMSVPPGEDIGAETHAHVEQTLFILSGQGELRVGGRETPVGPGSVIVVTPGTQHDVVNTGREPLQLYTVYAPPNHLDRRVHHTKRDAAADAENEAFQRGIE